MSTFCAPIDTKTAKELTFDRIVNEFGEMLLKYTKIYNS